jgi:hypothetical protein
MEKGEETNPQHTGPFRPLSASLVDPSGLTIPYLTINDTERMSSDKVTVCVLMMAK